MPPVTKKPERPETGPGRVPQSSTNRFIRGEHTVLTDTPGDLDRREHNKMPIPRRFPAAEVTSLDDEVSSDELDRGISVRRHTRSETTRFTDSPDFEEPSERQQRNLRELLSKSREMTQEEFVKACTDALFG